MMNWKYSEVFFLPLKTGSRLLGIVLAVALAACSQTKFVKSWKDASFADHPQKILVHTVGRDPTVKTIFENYLAEQLGKHGVVAEAGYPLLPASLVVDREALKRLVEEKGYDALFIAGPTNRKDLESLRPGEQSYAAAVYEGQVEDYDGFNGFVNGVVFSAGTYAGEEVSVEMVLYDVRSKKRVWSALSTTYIWDSGVDEVKPAVDKVVEMLVKEKVIP